MLNEIEHEKGFIILGQASDSRIPLNCVQGSESNVLFYNII